MNKQMGYWKGFGSCLILLAMIVGLGVTAGAASAGGAAGGAAAARQGGRNQHHGNEQSHCSAL